MKPIKILYIAGLGRSGSTLLGRVLGQLPTCVCVGELVHLWTNNPNQVLCGCGKTISACEFWTRVFEKAYGGVDNIPYEKALLNNHLVVRNIYVPRIMINLKTRFDWELLEYSNQYVALYKTIQEVTGCDFIIDFSKNLGLLFLLARNPNIDLRVIHLIRDLRGVAHSWRNPKKRLDVLSGDVMMKSFSHLTSTWRWVYRNIFISLTRRSFNQYIRIFYEDFIASPRNVISDILEQLEVSEKDLTFIQTDRVNLVHKTHTIWGNPNKVMEGIIPLKLDIGWQRKMSFSGRCITFILGWPLLLNYGYLHSKDRGTGENCNSD